MSAIARSTADQKSDIVWFAHECMNNGVRLEAYIESADRAGDRELVEFFRRAQYQTSQAQGRAGR